MPVSSTGWNNAAGGDWTSAGNWTAGVPTSAVDATIGIAGGYTVSLVHESGQAKSLTISNTSATLAVRAPSGTLGSSLTISGNLDNAGTVDLDAVAGNLDGGSSLTVAGTLSNSGLLVFGNTNLSAATSVSAAALSNTGTLDLFGNGALAATDQATFTIASAAPATLSSTISVEGDADLVFASGGITAIAATGFLQLIGAEARISIGAGKTSTALTGLSSNAGTFQLRGNVGPVGFQGGEGGAIVTTTTGFNNSGVLDVDVVTGNFDGGSSLTIGGTLVNSGTVTIGNSNLSAPTTVSAKGFIDSGSLTLQGNGTLGTTNQATLAITGAAPTTLVTPWFVGGDADLEFSSGISHIGTTGSLILVGAQARISLGADTKSTALSGLSSNAGLFQLRGDLPNGGGGVVVTTTTGFNNIGTLDVDVVAGNFDGGSSLTIGGTLVNSGTLTIGNTNMIGPTTVSAKGFNDTSSLTLQGNATLNTTNQATLAIAGAAPTTLAIPWFVGGDADLEFTSGISQIGTSGSLVLVGAQARVSLGADTKSTALSGLSKNAGLLQLRGDLPNGAGGATLTTTTGLTNTGTLDVDVVTGNFDGGSSLTIGGTLVNSGSVSIGNSNMNAPTTVSANGYSGVGALTLQGNGASGTTNQATFAVAGPAPTTLAAPWFVGGDADLEFTGGISQIGTAGSLVLVGAQARISVGADTKSTALSGLSKNAGFLQLRGDLGNGAGGATFTTTTGLTNTGTLDVDVVTGNFDGGSSLTIGGTLVNSGSVSIGNSNMTGPTTVSATALVNKGTVNLQGGSSVSATLKVTGGGSDSGVINLNGDALLGTVGLAVTSGGSITVGGGATATGVVVANGGGETVSGGGTTQAPVISGGTLDLAVGALAVGAISFAGNNGTLEIDDATMPANTIGGLTDSDAIDLRALPWAPTNTAVFSNGKLTVTGSFAATLNLSGVAAGTKFVAIDDAHGGTRVTEVPAAGSPSQSPIVLNDFGWAQGWGSPDNPRIVTDVDGNGTTDYLGFGATTTFIAYGGTFSDGQGHTGPGFTPAVAAVNDFGTNEGYTATVQRGAAMTGAGVGASLYGQGFAGIYWYAATAASAQKDAGGKTYDVLQYQSTPNFYGNFGSQEGWTPANGFQIVKTTQSDPFASILGFGNDGIVVGPQAFAPGATAAASYVIPLAVGNGAGWNQQNDIRTFTDAGGNTIDLNHDGIADFVGMGPQGLVYALGNTSGAGGGYGLGPLQTAAINNGSPDLGDAQGWNNASSVRYVISDAKTGFDDIVAFGAAGVYVSMGQDPAAHGGQAFGQLYLAMPDFGSDQGWSVSQTPRLIGDVNGDGIPDIVGFGSNSTLVALGARDGNDALHFTLDPSRAIGNFGSAEGWSGTDPQTVRALGDVAGSGRSDLILSGAFNTQVWQFN